MEPSSQDSGHQPVIIAMNGHLFTFPREGAIRFLEHVMQNECAEAGLGVIARFGGEQLLVADAFFLNHDADWTRENVEWVIACLREAKLSFL